MESKITRRILTYSKFDFDDDYNYYLKKIDDIINNSSENIETRVLLGQTIGHKGV